MTNDLAFFYQLIGASYSAVAARDFTLGVVDADDSGITSAQLATLAADGKQLLAYASAGEAETFRDYFINGHWNTTPPDFLLGPNPHWPTGYRVKFWDPDWQDIVINRLMGLQAKGYLGAYLDVVDVYTVAEVQTAYAAEFPGGSVRQAMSDFIKKISSTMKAIDPGFKIMVQNAVGLLNKTDIGSLSEPLNPDTDYIAAIDGLGKESTFALADTYPISWGAWDARYVENMVNAGKLVVALEYPTLGNAGAENYAYTQALAAGYVPYLDVRDHTGQFTKFALNYQTESDLSSTTLGRLLAFADPGAPPPPPPTVGGGDDVVTGDAGNNTLSGGDGNDTLYGLDGHDSLSGDAGIDFIYGWTGNDSITGGNGDDVLFGDAGADTLSGGNDNDYLYGWTENDLIHGDAGNDVLYGDEGADTLYGDGGNDIVFGSTGNDSIIGDAGNDDLYGDDGNDTVTGGDGTDRLYGWNGDDSLIGGADNDSLSGDFGNDTLDAGTGNDWAYAGDGHDLLLMGDGSDWAFGDVGNDTVYAGAGADVVFTWVGNDVIYGEAGNDFLSAEMDNDTLDGGAGDDTLWGGAGADRFIYNGGVDRIADFAAGSDTILIQGFGADFVTVITPNIAYLGGHAVIDLGSGNSLIIEHVSGGSIQAGDFLFA